MRPPCRHCYCLHSTVLPAAYSSRTSAEQQQQKAGEGSPAAKGSAGYAVSASQRRKMTNSSLTTYKILVGSWGVGKFVWGVVGVFALCRRQSYPLHARQPTAHLPSPIDHSCTPPSLPQLAFLAWACIVLHTYGLSILLLRSSIKPVSWVDASDMP